MGSAGPIFLTTPRESIDVQGAGFTLFGLGGPAAPVQTSSKDALFDLTDPAFCSDHFRVYEFKVRTT